MQIFSIPHTDVSTDTSLNKKKGGEVRGFTLIELLISCAIIGIITAIVLIKYSSFDSTTLLKAAAYEIALNLREAQVKSVSVVRNDDENNSFDQPYGISFTPLEKKYETFRYNDAGDTSKPIPKYDINETDTKAATVGSVTLDRGMYIKDICVTEGNNKKCKKNGNSGIDRLDISFRRPEFTALFYAEGFGNNMDKISKAEITIASTNQDAGFIIEVTRLGQISINPIP